MLKKKNIFILSLGIMLGVFMGICGSVFAEKDDEPAIAAPAPATATTEAIPYEDLRTFTEIFGRIKKDYVEPVSDKKLLEDAVKGMLSGLDPHSAYLDTEEYQELKEGTSGSSAVWVLKSRWKTVLLKSFRRLMIHLHKKQASRQVI